MHRGLRRAGAPTPAAAPTRVHEALLGAVERLREDASDGRERARERVARALQEAARVVADAERERGEGERRRGLVAYVGRRRGRGAARREG